VIEGEQVFGEALIEDREGSVRRFTETKTSGTACLRAAKFNIGYYLNIPEKQGGNNLTH
jgi:hypothetical protein